VVEVLVAEGEGRKDAATHRMSGRARDNRLVHFVPSASPADAPDASGLAPRPGDIVTTRVTHGAPHHLIADGAPLSVRRTRAGDAWELRRGAPRGDGGREPPMPGEIAAPAPAASASASAPAPVLLGMPGRRG
jgi:tRNA-2-methylthio-N6-dimethylallyladenosine synthase